jgi:SAM-dependent methyltransferase
MSRSSPPAGEAGDDVRSRVRRFYEELPFNYEATDEAAAAQVRKNPIRAYPDLDAALRESRVRSVVEIGCGAGWFANAAALHYGKQVVAIDMTEAALARARRVATLVGMSAHVTFEQRDLFSFTPAVVPDLVVSIGVLHHTHDCAAAFRHVAGFLSPAGLLFVGLYHAPGRGPFLALFREVLAREGEAAAFEQYCALNPGQADPQILRSWFRDQVLHPHESQHTLAEVSGWLDNLGFELRSTSINRFAPFADRHALFALERDYEALSHRRNAVEKRFFPGFFTVMAQRAHGTSTPAAGTR